MAQSPLGTPAPAGSTATPGTLRAYMEEAQASGRTSNLRQAVGIVVPLAVEAQSMHEGGQLLFVHPSCVAADDAGHYHIDPRLAQNPPVLPRDKACMAPEERAGRPGNARATVYAIGAILYELVTGESVGPGMRRPTEIVPSLPADLEVILSKSLVADPSHRPDDIGALAQAIHHLAPKASVPPPAADESHLDHDGTFEVDVSMSMLPPAPPTPAMGEGSGPYDMGVQDRQSGPDSGDSATELVELKAQLEADPRARYVVVKDGMDHGPFSSVELLQQIANHTFEEGDVLKDNLSQDERAIGAWEQFAPFAEHARLHRDHKKEKAAIEQVVVEEKKATRGKAAVGLGLVGAVLAVGVVWFLTARGQRSDEVAVVGEEATSVEVDGGLAAGKGRRGGGGARRGGGVVGRSGGFPQVAGGTSCSAARNAYVEEYKIGGGDKVKADLTAGAYGAVLNRGSYFGHCGVPDNVTLNICAAVQNGRAVGVTVTTKPSRPGINRCVSSAVRGLSFPSHPRLDVTTTRFAAQ